MSETAPLLDVRDLSVTISNSDEIALTYEKAIAALAKGKRGSPRRKRLVSPE